MGNLYQYDYKVAGACVVHISNPNQACSGSICPEVDSWANHQAGWRFIGGTVVETTYRDPEGRPLTMRFDQHRKIGAVTDILGRTNQYERDPNTRRITSRTDSQGRIWSSSYYARHLHLAPCRCSAPQCL